MAQAIYVNLPVSDLRRSKAFFEALGLSFNPRFTNDDAAALVIAETIFAMLHTPDSFRRFVTKEVADAHRTTEALLALQVESKQRVHDLADRAVAAGGREPRPPQDRGFMVLRSFEDPDGHVWEVFWMDPAAAPQCRDGTET